MSFFFVLNVSMDAYVLSFKNIKFLWKTGSLNKYYELTSICRDKNSLLLAKFCIMGQ